MTKIRLEDLQKAMTLIEKDTSDYRISFEINRLDNLVISYFDLDNKHVEIELQNGDSGFHSTVLRKENLDSVVKK